MVKKRRQPNFTRMTPERGPATGSPPVRGRSITPTSIGKWVDKRQMRCWRETGTARARELDAGVLGVCARVAVLCVMAIAAAEQLGTTSPAPFISCGLLMAAAAITAAFVTRIDRRSVGSGPWPWLPRPCGADEQGVRIRRGRRLVPWSSLLSITDLGHRGWLVRHTRGSFGLDPASRHQVDLCRLIAKILEARDSGRLLLPEQDTNDIPGTALSLASEDPHDTAQARALSPADPPDDLTESEDA